MKKLTVKAIRCELEALNSRMPLLLPCTVRVVSPERLAKLSGHPVGKTYGQCRCDGTSFEILLVDTLGTDFLNCLSHEWAHAFAWMDHPSDVVADHGPEFGIAWARAYCVLTNEDYSPCSLSHPLPKGASLPMTGCLLGGGSWHSKPKVTCRKASCRPKGRVEFLRHTSRGRFRGQG